MTHSFPTRRSSDLPGHLLAGLAESARNFAFLAFMYGIIRSAGDDERQRAVKLVYFTVAGVIGLQIVVAGVLPRFEGEAVVHQALVSTAHVIGLTIAAGPLVLVPRSAERRVGKGCVIKGRSWW